jgi:hypothetical protein
MEKHLLNYSLILSDTPKAWQDFVNFYQEEFSNYEFMKGLEITKMPFEMQLGIFLKYFNENGVELDICNTEYSKLPESILEAFKIHEKVISHYS